MHNLDSGGRRRLSPGTGLTRSAPVQKVPVIQVHQNDLRGGVLQTAPRNFAVPDRVYGAYQAHHVHSHSPKASTGQPIGFGRRGYQGVGVCTPRCEGADHVRHPTRLLGLSTSRLRVPFWASFPASGSIRCPSCRGVQRIQVQRGSFGSPFQRAPGRAPWLSTRFPLSPIFLPGDSRDLRAAPRRGPGRSYVARSPRPSRTRGATAHPVAIAAVQLQPSSEAIASPRPEVEKPTVPAEMKPDPLAGLIAQDRGRWAVVRSSASWTSDESEDQRRRLSLGPVLQRLVLRGVPQPWRDRRRGTERQERGYPVAEGSTLCAI